MTDDLSKYEELRDELKPYAKGDKLAASMMDAITELVAIVRSVRKAQQWQLDQTGEWITRAEAAEKELINVRNDLDAAIEENAKLREALEPFA
jgi:ClpP class serine protease